MDDNLTLSDFIGNKIVSGEDKVFKAGNKNIFWLIILSLLTIVSRIIACFLIA